MYSFATTKKSGTVTSAAKTNRAYSFTTKKKLTPAAQIYANQDTSANANESEQNKGGFIGGLGYFFEKIGAGFMQGVEGIVDYTVGGVAELFGADEFAEDVFESDWMNYNHADDWYNPSEGWKVAGDVAGGIGSSLPGIAAGVAVTLASGGTMAATGVGLVTSGLAAAGTSTKEAFHESGQLGAKEFGYGAMMGAVEAGTEALSGALGAGLGKSIKAVGTTFGKTAGRVAGKTVGKTVGKTAVKAASKGVQSLTLKSVAKQAGKEFLSEAFEEGFAEIVSPYAKRLTYDPNAKNATVEEVLYAATIGGISGVLMGGARGGFTQAVNNVRGNSVVKQGGEAEVMALAKQMIDDDAGGEYTPAIKQIYERLSPAIESGAELTGEQRRALGELKTYETANIMQGAAARSAIAAVNGADAIAARLNADGRYKMVDGKFTFVEDASTIKKGATVREITAEDITSGYDANDKSSIYKALKSNDVLRYIASADAAGRFIMSAKEVENAALAGNKIRTQADLNKFIETASEEQKAAVGRELGITDWNTLNIDGLNEKISAYHESGKAEAYKQKIAKIDEIKAKAESKARSIPKAISISDGAIQRYADADSNIAVARTGDSFIIYDYTSGNVSKDMTRAEVNSALARYRQATEGAATPAAQTSTKSTATNEAAAEVKSENASTNENLSSEAKNSQNGTEIEIKDENISKSEAEAKEFDALATEKVKGYDKLSAADKSMIRKIFREARATGISEADALSYARVAARTGLDIQFNKQECYKGKNEAGEDVYHAGFYDPENNRIVVNPETNKKHTVLLIHELSHAMRSYLKNGEVKYAIDENAVKVKKKADGAEEAEVEIKVSPEMWAEIKKYYSDENGKLDTELALDEASAYYAEALYGTEGAIDLLLGEKPTLRQKILSFFAKSAEYYSTDEKLSREARRHFKKFKAMFDAFAARNQARSVEAGAVKSVENAKVTEKSIEERDTENKKKFSWLKKARKRSVLYYGKDVRMLSDGAFGIVATDEEISFARLEYGEFEHTTLPEKTAAILDNATTPVTEAPMSGTNGNESVYIFDFDGKQFAYSKEFLSKLDGNTFYSGDINGQKILKAVDSDGKFVGFLLPEKARAELKITGTSRLKSFTKSTEKANPSESKPKRAPKADVARRGVVRLVTNARREALRGAAVKNGKQYISDGNFAARYTDVIDGITEVSTEEYPFDTFDRAIKGVENTNESERIQIDADEIRQLVPAKKSDYPKTIAKIGDNYYQLHYVSKLLDSLANPKVYVQPGAIKSLYFKGDNGEAILLPLNFSKSNAPSVAYEADYDGKESGKSARRAAMEIGGESVAVEIEEDKDLVAIHNLTEQNLIDTLELGGFPMPSIAIIRKGQEHSNYGNISVIFGRETIDPEASSDNKVYGSDAWTPTSSNARAEYKVDYEAMRKLERKLYELGEKIADGAFSSESLIRRTGVEDASEYSAEKLAERLSNYDEVRAAYLADKGKKFEPEYKVKEYNRFGNEPLKKYVDTVGEQHLAEVNAKLYLGERDVVDAEKDLIRSIIRENYIAKHADSLNRRPDLKEKRIEAYMEKQVSDFAIEDFIDSAWTFYQEGGAVTEEVDRLVTSDKLRQAVDDKDVREWLKPQIENILGEKGIRNSKDPFDYLGRSRSFEELHYPYTVENIVRAMKETATARGANTFGVNANALIATATPSYKSVDEMRADKSRLKIEEAAKYQKILSELDSDLYMIEEDIMRTNKRHSDDYYDEGETIGSIITEAATGSKTAVGVQRAFAKDGYKITLTQATKVLNLYAKAAQVPTGYFEAKPERVVSFDEIKMVELPESASEALKDKLTERNIPYEVYGNTDSDRTAKIDKLKGVRFSAEFGNSEVKSTAYVKAKDVKAEDLLDLVELHSETDYRLGDYVSPKFKKAIKMYGNLAHSRLYRGIDAAEFDFIVENGYIKSNSSYNFSDQQGQTRLAPSIKTAYSYATYFAPTEMRKRFFEDGSPSYIVEIANFEELGIVNEDNIESYTEKEIDKKYITRILELTYDTNSEEVRATDITIDGMNSAEGKIHGVPEFLKDKETGTILFKHQDENGVEDGKYISEKNPDMIFDFNMVKDFEGKDFDFNDYVGISGKESNLEPFVYPKRTFEDEDIEKSDKKVYNKDIYTATNDFYNTVPYYDRSDFARSLSNKTRGINEGELRTIYINTPSQIYAFIADGYMRGEMIKNFSRSEYEKLIEARKEHFNAINSNRKRTDLWFDSVSDNGRESRSDISLSEGGTRSARDDSLSQDSSERNRAGNIERERTNPKTESGLGEKVTESTVEKSDSRRYSSETIENVAKSRFTEPDVKFSEKIKAKFTSVKDKLYIDAVDEMWGIEKYLKEYGKVKDYAAVVQQVRASDTIAQTMIGVAQYDITESGKGKRLGDGITKIFKKYRVRKIEADFNDYLLHQLNVDRMTLRERSLEWQDELLAAYSKAQADFNRAEALVKQGKAKHIPRGIRKALTAAKKAYESFEVIENKPVFGANEKRANDITADESRKIIEEYEKEHPEFKKSAEEVWAYLRNLQEMRVKGGLISQESADVMAKYYPHYVPSFRDTTKAGGAGVVKNESQLAVKSTIKSAKGGSEDVYDIEESIAVQTTQTVKAIKMNQLARAVYDAAQKSGDTTYVLTREAAEERANADPDDDVTVDLTPKNNQVVFFLDGKKVEMNVSEEIFAGFKGVNDGSVPKSILWKAASKILGGFKNLVTQYSPTFAARNFIRDMQDAYINTKHPKRFLGNIPAALKDMVNNGAEWQLYLAYGGFASTVFDAKGFTNGVGNRGFEAFRQISGIDENDFKKMGKALKNVLTAVGNANAFIEQLTRFTEFKASLAAGDSVEVAINNSAEVTTNFSRHGKTVKVLNATIIPFLNASVQGFDKLLRVLAGPYRERSLAALGILLVKILAIGIAPQILNMIMNGDDEDYENLTNEVKENYFLIKAGDEFIKIPRGRAAGAFGGIANRLRNVSRGEDFEFLDYIETVGSNVTPVDSFSRTIFAPINDVRTNTTWYGGEIEGRQFEGVRPGQRFDESTSEIAKWIGEKINRSPKKIHYLIDQYSGVIGDFLLPATTAKAEKGYLASNFLLDPATNNKLSNEFYELYDEAQYSKNEGNVTALYQLKHLNDVKASVSELYDEITKIQQSDKSNSEKLQEVRTIRILINNLYKTAKTDYAAYTKAIEATDGIFDDADAGEQRIRHAVITQKMYGSEKALKEYNTDVYAKSQLFNKAGVSYDLYYTYYFATKGIQSDLDKDGEVIAGSKRKKVIKAITNLGLSRQETLLLIAASGYKINDGDVRGVSALAAKNMILKYILGMNATKAEKEELAKACGFKVKNGKILKD